MALHELLYHLCHPLLGTAARNRWLIHRLFHIRVPKQVTVHFDPTTLALLLALRNTVTPSDKTALEVGIGQGALLANSLQKSTAIDVEGVDCSEARVLSSCTVAAYNRLQPRFYMSDLFSKVGNGRSFDLIFFNPPYVPTGQGRRLKLTRHMRADSDRVWDGGQDGSGVLRTFLQQAHGFLSSHGRLLFGIQPIFLSRELTESTIADCKWQIRDRYSPRWLPACVYVLRSCASRDTVTNPA